MLDQSVPLLSLDVLLRGLRMLWVLGMLGSVLLRLMLLLETTRMSEPYSRGVARQP